MRKTGKRLRKVLCGNSQYSILGFFNYLESQNITTTISVSNPVVGDNDMEGKDVVELSTSLNSTIEVCGNDADWTWHMKGYLTENFESEEGTLDADARRAYGQRTFHNKKACNSSPMTILAPIALLFQEVLCAY